MRIGDERQAEALGGTGTAGTAGAVGTVGTVGTAEHALDNPAWHALTGRQAAFAEGDGPARRYQVDVAPFAALARFDGEAWAALAQLVGPGGEAVVSHAGHVPAPPDGWTVEWRLWVMQMVADEPSGPAEPATAPAPPIRRLTDADLRQMHDLVELTEPGPFRPRVVELGTYLGIVEDGRLLAMAGERLQLDGHTEVSAVCTHPTARRRGLAAAVVREVLARIRARGETPILHVAEQNTNARRLYEQLGFRDHQRHEYVRLTAPD